MWSYDGGQPELISVRDSGSELPALPSTSEHDRAPNSRWTHCPRCDAWNQGALIERLRAATGE